MDWDFILSIIRLGCYGFIAMATFLTGVSLWRLTRRPEERREEFKKQVRRWSRFMFAICLWATTLICILLIMDNSPYDVRWIGTIPAIIIALAVADIWHYFFVNGGGTK